MTFKTVDRELVRFLLAHGQGQYAIELANLWAEMSYWNSRSERFVVGAYSRAWGTSEKRVKSLLDRLESLQGCTRKGPPNWPDYVAHPMPWNVETPPATPPISGGHSESHHHHGHSQGQKSGLTPEQQQQAVDTYNQMAPSHWAKPTKLSPTVIGVMKGYVKRAGGFDEFMHELRWQLKRAQRSPMANPDGKKPTWLTLLGSSEKQDKQRWKDWREENPDAFVPGSCTTSDSLDTLETPIDRMWQKHALPEAVTMGIRLSLTAYGSDVKRQERWSEETWDEKHAEAWLHFYKTPFQPND